MTRHLSDAKGFIVACVIVALFSLLMVRPAKASREHGFPPPPVRLLTAARHVFHQHMWTAICVSWVESKYNHLNDVDGSSWSSTGDHGWMQINYAAHHRPGETENAFHARMAPIMTNLYEAFAISRHGTDWSAWTTYSSGLCRGLG